MKKELIYLTKKFSILLTKNVRNISAFQKGKK